MTQDLMSPFDGNLSRLGLISWGSFLSARQAAAQKPCETPLSLAVVAPPAALTKRRFAGRRTAKTSIESALSALTPWDCADKYRALSAGGERRQSERPALKNR
jgi:hypothetical protein